MLLIDGSLLILCGIELQSLLSCKSSLHAELHDGSEEDTKIDLEWDDHHCVLDGLDVSKVHVCKDLENSISSGCRDGNADQEHESNQPILAGVCGEFLRAALAGVDVDEGADSIVEMLNNTEPNAKGEEDHVKILENLGDLCKGCGLLRVCAGDRNPPL